VQTNTEFHQDWTAQANQGHEVRWKQGVSLETTAKERSRRYGVQIAPRRPRRWIWVVILGIAIGGYLRAIGFL